MMAAAYFIKQGMTADEAIKYVRKYRPEAIEMTSQERYLKDYEYYLNINK
jgi:protein-tyrosine phosphatase